MNVLKDLGALAAEIFYVFARTAVVVAVVAAVGYAVYGVALLIGR